MDSKLYDAELSWSMLSPLPVTVYSSMHDEYLTMWNGAVMPQIYALSMASERFGIFPTSAMKDAMQSTYEKLYYSGAFPTNTWGAIVAERRTYIYLSQFMSTHVNTVCKDKTLADILDWFNLDYAKVV